MKQAPTVRKLCGDFETTVYDGQENTEVWASALVELNTEDVMIFHSIDETWDYLRRCRESMIIYYHNLKFDGSFWLDFIMKKTTLKPGYQIDDNGNAVWLKRKDMPNNSYRYNINSLGQWYSITICLNHHTIEFRDSLKLLPFSVKQLGESFKTKHRKLDMEYNGYRYAGCEITEKEKLYIANDVLVVKEALEIMLSQGHDKLTIGSCCLAEFRKSYDRRDYDMFFPDVSAMELEDIYGAENVDRYIRRSYRGGWCYLVKEKAQKLFTKGITADVNSLYPSVMHSMSGNRYPVGKPKFWSGNYIPEKAERPNAYYFIRVRTRFRIKPGYLPFLQVKGNMLYRPSEALTTSDYFDKKTGKYYRYYTDYTGEKKDTKLMLTLTCTDWKLFNEHYDLFDCEILDGCYFLTEIGLFDEYINKYKEIKMNNKGALRTLAKLFLNNLYGKMASSTDSSFYIATVGQGGALDFKLQLENDKRAGYIPIGSAVTSYARDFTIRTAQKNFHGASERGFIYADTDSIHCDLEPSELIDVPQHPTEFCHWKLESTWDEGWFVRQKTYLEHVIEEDLEPIEEPYYSIRCAGMPEHCKELFLHSVLQDWKDDLLTPMGNNKYSKDEIEFMKKKRNITDFNYGLIVPGKLLPVRIEGGVVLHDTTFEMR